MPANPSDATTVRPSLAGDLFQPRRQIDRGTDAGEVEPVAAADIAVENSPDMQGDAEAKPFDGVADRILQSATLARDSLGGFEDARANLLLVADIFVDRKNREQPVAHIFQHFAAMIPDRGDLAIEVMVQDVDHGFRRQRDRTTR